MRKRVETGNETSLFPARKATKWDPKQRLQWIALRSDNFGRKEMYLESVAADELSPEVIPNGELRAALELSKKAFQLGWLSHDGRTYTCHYVLITHDEVDDTVDVEQTDGLSDDLYLMQFYENN